MSIDEQKIISDIKKDSSGVNDYRSYIRLDREYKYRRQQKLINLASLLTVVYTIIALIVFVFFKNDTRTFLYWPFNPPSDQIKIKDLENRILDSEKKIDFIDSVINSSTTKNVSLDYINSQIYRLNSRQGALEESISLDSEKALTAGLLREKQRALEVNFSELREAQIRLDSKFDNFMITVILIPIITLVGSLIVWFFTKRNKKDE
jgi:hypothetical protein